MKRKGLTVNDGGIQWYAQQGQWEEYQEWLADPKAQAEYREYLTQHETNQENRNEPSRIWK
jgi:hypothetical protein